MSTLHMNLAPASLARRDGPAPLAMPPAVRNFLHEAAQVLRGSMVRVAPAPELAPALRRDLGLD